MLNIKHFNAILSLKKIFNDFNLITALIFILGFIHIFYKLRWTANGLESAVNLWNPFWLLFGPLLFYAYKIFAKQHINMKRREYYVHLLPSLAFSIFYAIAFFSTNMDDPWKNKLFIYYQNSFFVIIFSLLAYAIYVLIMTLRIEIPGKLGTEALLITMSAIYMLTGLIGTMMYMAWGILHVDIGLDYRFFSYGLIFFANIIIAWHWIFIEDKEVEVEQENNQHISYRNSALDEDLAETYKNRITNFFDNSTAYLEPNLSLESLAVELDIPKHYLSQLFNVFFKKNFHAFVAEYRISYAIKLLDHNHNRLTIESLAYSCGFNSKTSFNRYFKSKTGLTPSAYQLRFA